MDYSVCEDTQAIVDLSRKIFADAVDDAALTQHDGQIDQTLWQTCADAGLIGLHMPESAGGLGLSFETLCRVLEQLGRINAPIPLLQSALAGTVVAKSRCCGSVDSVLAGDACFALSLSDGLIVADGRVLGVVDAVAYADTASAIVLRCDQQLIVVDRANCNLIEPQKLSSGLPAAQVELDLTFDQVDFLEGLAELESKLKTATAWLTLGILSEALARTASYTAERKQFAKPLATFQAVAHRAANGYIDVECLRGVAEQAAWRIDEGKLSSLEANMAYWWACEAAHRTVHTTQHLHGGMGADLTYPIHRFFLRAKELEFSLGGAEHTLAIVGRELVTQAPAERRLQC